MNKIKKIAPALIVFAAMAIVIFAQDSLMVDSSGYVGILTTGTPQSELEVNGRIRDKTGFVMPVGTIIAYGGTTAPDGWLLCNGSAISRTTYADLFTAISENYGDGDGSTTFNIPDLRGMFLRGVDGGAGNDPNRTTRTANNSGGLTGDNVGSEQEDAFQGHIHSTYLGSHSHGLRRPTTSGSGGSIVSTASDPYVTYSSGYIESTNLGTPSSGDPLTGSHGAPNLSTETRPKNVNVNYIIKY